MLWYSLKSRKGDDMALRQYQSHEYQYEEYIPKEKKTSFQVYKTPKANQERIRELFFFIHIALFSLIMVLSSYIYLSLGMSVFMALLLANVTGMFGLHLVKSGLAKTFKNTYNRNRKKK